MSGTSEAKKKRNRERYYFLKEHGICTRCGHEDALKDHVLCGECTYRKNEYEAKRRNAMSDEEKKQKNKAREEFRRKRAAQGLCIICGKPCCKRSRVRCNYHRLVLNQWQHEYQKRKNADEPVIERQYKAPQPRKPAANHPWNMNNRIIFRKKA